MSTAERQTIALTVLCTGMLLLLREKKFAPHLNAAILYAEETTSEGMCKLPDGDNPYSADAFSKQSAIVEKVFSLLPDSNAPIYAGSMIYLCNHIMTDLCEKIRDKNKLSILEPAREACQGLVDLYDKEGIDYAAMEAADTILNATYKELGFIR